MQHRRRSLTGSRSPRRSSAFRTCARNSAAWWRSRMSRSTSMPARWSRWSATTAPASRRWSRSSAACYPPTAGRILVDGEEVRFANPSQAAGARHPGGLSGPRARRSSQPVYMNLFLGRETVTGPFRRLDRRRMIRESEDLVRGLDVRIPSAKASDPRPFRRPAPGRRDRPRDALGVEAGADGRADRRARRRRDGEGREHHPRA